MSDKWSNAAAAAQNPSRKAYSGWEDVHNEPENFNDEGWLARSTRAVQEDSRQVSRRALQRLNEAEQIAQNSLSTLNTQSEQLHRMEHKLDTANSQARLAEVKTTELKAYNRFFMLPTFGASKKAKAAEAKLKAEQEEAARLEAERKQNVANGGGYYSGSMDPSKSRSESNLRNASGRGDSRSNTRNNSRSGNDYYNGKSYSTPDGIERDELEEEIDSNVDGIASGLSRLKMMAQTMNSEIERSTEHIQGIVRKTDETRDRVEKVNRDVSKIANGGRRRK